MSKTFKHIKYLAPIIALLLITPFYLQNIFAQNNNDSGGDIYNLLAPIPCVGGSCSGNLATQTTLPQYIKGFVQLSIGISAVFAVIMIVIGGFQYMTSDALQGKQDGKTRIKNSFIALLLVAASFIILQTINPNLLNVNLRIETAQTAVSGTQTGGLVEGTCTTCEAVNNGLPLGGNTNTQILPDTNTKLTSLNTSLNSSNITWAITEAYPPKVNHANPCHAAGSCIDANFRSPTTPTSQNVNTFINAANSSGLRAIYEVKTQAEKNTLVSGGVPANSVMVVEAITGPHFSVYNCSAHPESCRTLP